MEKWKEYRKGIIPKDQYAGKISYKEGMKPVIDLQSWYRGENTNYVKIEFNQALSVRVFEEHLHFVMYLMKVSHFGKTIVLMLYMKWKMETM